MATSVVPALIDALVLRSTAALPNLLVFDGYGNTEDPGDFLMVGVDDPDSDDWAEAATAEQSWANIGHVVRDETGTVTCVALSWNGNDDPKVARDTAYAITAALEGLLRTDPSLGLGPHVWVEFGTRQALTQARGPDGAAAQLVFSLAFRARI